MKPTNKKPGAKRTTGDKRWFKVISTDQFQRIRFALAERDFEDFAKVLKTVKMTKEHFYTLCRDAIDSKEILPLKIVLDLYPSYWNQELFGMLTEYIVSVKAFKMASFIDDYIDKVNKYHNSINEWNAHVKNKKLLAAQKENFQPAEKQSVFKKFFSKIHNIFKKNK